MRERVDATSNACSFNFKIIRLRAMDFIVALIFVIYLSAEFLLYEAAFTRYLLERLLLYYAYVKIRR